MKKRALVFLLGISLALSPFNISHAVENDTDVIYTGTQQTVKDNETDVDEDIRASVDAEVLSEWEDIDIKTADDLVKLSTDCRLDVWSRNKHVYLKSDIDLAGSGFKGIPTFGGTFDGNGYTITGLGLHEGESYTGFFAYLQTDAIVTNLNIEGRVEPTGSRVATGGIAGDNSGVISGCSFNGVVAGGDYAGGIAGFNELSGIISDSISKGEITGNHFTGGITGENFGNIVRCVNKAGINTSKTEVKLSLDDFDIEAYTSSLLDTESGSDKDEAKKLGEVVDTGGIAGLSLGIIQHCTNEGTVGYEHVGYNVGGIAGRQSGYIVDCINRADVLGRKDVGGIVGQAEPYVTVDLTQDIAYQLSENISKLHDIITVTLNDAGNQSDVISNRLSIIQQFTSQALDDTRFIADGTVDYANGISGAVNEAFSRVDYILEESSKKDGALDQISYSAKNSKSAVRKMGDAVEKLDIYDYMSDREKEDYDNYKKTIEDATKEYDGYVEESYDAYYNYYMFTNAGTTGYEGTGDLAYIKDDENYTLNKNAISIPADKAAPAYGAANNPSSNPVNDSTSGFFGEFKLNGVTGWVHHREAEQDYEDIYLPDSSDETQRENDEKLMEKAADEASAKSEAYANAMYSQNHPGTGAIPHTYSGDMSDAAKGIAEIVERHLPEMSEAAREEAEEAVSYLESATSNLESAGSQTKDMITDIGSRDAIQFPVLSAEYRAHTTNLSNNMQAMNDNFGHLNNEMNNASDVLIDDLKAVTDQFDTIMRLYTDAIDGVLDMDYTSNIEDNSLEVAETCVDATITECTNYGRVEGNIDVAGVAGTMAIEYDFDLESDVTGIKDSRMNSTFLTKCVLRENNNYGRVTAEKSYAGGICGLQEMGTVLRNGGYETVKSNSGNYVGGVAGSSLSYIVKSYAKCALSGGDYVGGIAGDGTHINDCVTLVSIDSEGAWNGAIAGHIGDDGVVRSNYFVSDTLAGIDRVSYSKKAEPVSYEQLMMMEPDAEESKETIKDKLPADFDSLKVSFVLLDEDDEETYIGTAKADYGEKLDPALCPTVPGKEGYYVKWDISDESLVSDTKVTAEYVRYVTTLSGEATLSNGQSPILVDGMFKEGDRLEETNDITDVDIDTGIYESWTIKIPDDGQETHRLRYHINDSFDDEKWQDSIIAYEYENGDWKELESTGTMGSYLTYDIKGNNVRLRMQVKNLERRYHLLMALIILGGILVVAVFVIVLIMLFKKRRKIAGAAKALHEKTQNAVHNMGGQNQLFYHGEEDKDGNPVEPMVYDEPTDELDAGYGQDEASPDNRDEDAEPSYFDGDVYDE